MSEVKTTRDIFAEIETRGGACSHYPRIQDVRLTADSMTTLAREGLELLRAQEEAGLKLLDDLHAIPGADAVVTEEGLEAGAMAIADSLGIAWTPENDVEKNTLRHEARVVLKAAGIVVVNEMVRVHPDVVFVNIEDENGTVFTVSGDDIIYIVRADKED